MKTKILFFLIFTISTFFIKAQSSIFVTTTGTCSGLTGEYMYDGTLNGKNHYTREYADGTETFYFHVSFDNVKWVIYVDDAIDEVAFYNPNVPEGMLPPNNGWIKDICYDGTMFIEGGVNIGTDSLLQNDDISIFTNSNNILILELYKLPAAEFEINIYSITGRTILSKKVKGKSSRYELDMRGFSTGIYIVEIMYLKKRIFIR